MYKKQLRIQKIICLVALIAAAACFVYSLGIITDIHDALKSAIRNANKLENTKIPGAAIYYHMQAFNKQFVTVGIGLILVACMLFLTNTHSRRRYYIGNFVSVGVYTVATTVAAWWYHGQIAAFKYQFLTTVDFEVMKEYSEKWGTLYLDNTNLLDLHYYVAGLGLLSAVLLIGNAIWKVVLMRQEAKLIQRGKEAAV